MPCLVGIICPLHLIITTFIVGGMITRNLEANIREEESSEKEQGQRRKGNISDSVFVNIQIWKETYSIRQAKRVVN